MLPHIGIDQRDIVPSPLRYGGRQGLFLSVGYIVQVLYPAQFSSCNRSLSVGWSMGHLVSAIRHPCNSLSQSCNGVRARVHSHTSDNTLRLYYRCIPDFERWLLILNNSLCQKKIGNVLHHRLILEEFFEISIVP